MTAFDKLRCLLGSIKASVALAKRCSKLVLKDRVFLGNSLFAPCLKCHKRSVGRLGLEKSSDPFGQLLLVVPAK